MNELRLCVRKLVRVYTHTGRALEQMDGADLQAILRRAPFTAVNNTRALGFVFAP